MKKIRITIIGLLLTLSLCIICVTATHANKVSATDQKVMTEVEYNATYKLGETITLQSAKFSYSGSEYDAGAVLRYPSGKTYKSKTVVLTESGIYNVDYSAITSDGKLLKQTKTFTVLADVYAFDGDGKYEYGTNAYLGEDVKGLNVSLGRDSKFNINKAIDVSNLTNEDSIIKIYATPTIKGIADVGKVYIRLTDAYDSSRFVELQYRGVASFGYVSAIADGQYLTGLGQLSTPGANDIDYDNYFFTLYHNNPIYGHVSRSSISGEIDKTNRAGLILKYFSNSEDYTEEDLFKYNSLEIRMDYLQKRVYSQEDGQYSVSRCICADFDDERTLGGKTPWEGFTTGEVLVSVYASDYAATNFNFFVTDVYGHNLMDSAIKNEIAPTLSIDIKGYDEENLPDAVIGKKYELYDAVAFDDVEGEKRVTKSVYFNGNNSTKSIVSVADNGFIPTREGIYTLEYSATDNFGNKTVKSVNVKAIAREKIEYTLTDSETAYEAGEEICVRKINILNASNIYNLKITATNEEKNVEYEIDNEKLCFVPLYAGKYNINYLYSDYCSQQLINYEISVSASDLVVFEDNIILPKYIIKGITYPVKELYGYTFNNLTKREKAKLYIRENGTNEVPVESDTYCIKNAIESVELVYKIGSAKKVYTIKVIDVSSASGEEYTIDLAKYFYNKNNQFTVYEDSSKIRFMTDIDKAEDGNAKLEVINPTYLINDFNICFDFTTGETSFESVKVEFTSAYNPNKSIEFKFIKENGNAKVYINSESYSAQSSVTSRFATAVVGEDKFNITYMSTTNEFDICGYVVDANELLKNFDDLFYITFELCGITGDSSINFTRIVNQKINNDEYDGVKPIFLYDSFKSYYVIGDEISISKVRIYDFVDPNPSCKVTLNNTEGFLISNNGVKLDGAENVYNTKYTVKVENYNKTNFKIDCEDFSGNSYRINLPLTIKDVFPPSIAIEIKKNLYQVGDDLTIADYKVSDDVTSESEIKVTKLIIAKDGSVSVITDEQYVLNTVGEYRIYYIARDEAGNNSYANYLIKVE